jgi:curved DNA-binding protein CbpA
VLGVTQGASAAEVKKAFRKKALALHPDVNKAPDAQVRDVAKLHGRGGGKAE